MRRILHRWALVELLLPCGCFAEPSGVADDGATTTTAAESGSSSATGDDAGTDMTAGAETETSSSGTTSGVESTDGASDTGDDATSGASSDDASTGEPQTWCETQPAEVVVCMDFDGAVPFLGVDIFEMHGTIDASEDQSVSSPRSMRAVVTEDAAENSVATVQTPEIDRARTPYAASAAVDVWVDPGCFAGDTNDRLVLGQIFHDGVESFLNLTVWITPSETILYSSTEPAASPSVGHPMTVDFPTGEWVTVELTYAADTASALLSVAGTTEELALSNVDEVVLAEIAQISPHLTVGTNMYAQSPTCTMYFDDVTVTVL